MHPTDEGGQMVRRGMLAATLAVSLPLAVSGCAGGGEEEAATPMPSPTSRPSATGSASETARSPSREPTTAAPVVHSCEAVTDAATLNAMEATLAAPYNGQEFPINGAVSLRTQYEHAEDPWTYLAARVGPNLNGNQQLVAVWALPDGRAPLGVELGIEQNDGDESPELTVDNEAAFSTVAETGPYFYNDDRTKVAACALNEPGGTTRVTQMTLNHYEQLRPDETTLEDLYTLVGEGVCEESTESSVDGITTLGLTCRGRGAPGANAVLIFQNGVLTSKAQAGLT